MADHQGRRFESTQDHEVHPSVVQKKTDDDGFLLGPLNGSGALLQMLSEGPVIESLSPAAVQLAGEPEGPTEAEQAEARAAASQLDARVKELEQKAEALLALPTPAADSIAATVVMSGFIGVGNELYEGWDNHKNAATRVSLVGAAANVALAAAGVPSVKVAEGNGTESTFDKATWTITVGATLFKGEKPDKGRLVTVCKTVYHEARHAEQYFNIARMLAGRGKEPDEIVSECGVSAEIVPAAVGKKMKPDDPQLQVSDKLLKSLNDPDNRAFLANLRSATDAYKAAQTREAQKNVYLTMIKPRKARYEALAPEADAFGIEAKMKKLWEEG